MAGQARKSSLFDIKHSHIIQKDKGASYVSLAEEPAMQRKGPKVQLENTYKLDPDQRLNIGQLRDILQRVLNEKFHGAKYDPLEMGHLCKTASQSIKEEVKGLHLDRYKLVCTVTVSENSGQGVKEASRFLWDDKKDNFVDAIYNCASFAAQGALYAMYFE